MSDPVLSREGRLVRLERRQRRLEAAVALFVVLHALLIPLLPVLFAHALQASVGALALACALLAIAVTRRTR